MAIHKNESKRINGFNNGRPDSLSHNQNRKRQTIKIIENIEKSNEKKGKLKRVSASKSFWFNIILTLVVVAGFVFAIVKLYG
jgi:Mg2+/citrate symporter